jgi:hypothetical protein
MAPRGTVLGVRPGIGFVFVAVTTIVAFGGSARRITAQTPQPPGDSQKKVSASSEDDELKRLREAAARGDAHAQFALGLMYETGEGVVDRRPRDSDGHPGPRSRQCAAGAGGPVGAPAFCKGIAATTRNHIATGFSLEAMSPSSRLAARQRPLGVVRSGPRLYPEQGQRAWSKCAKLRL